MGVLGAQWDSAIFVVPRGEGAEREAIPHLLTRVPGISFTPSANQWLSMHFGERREKWRISGEGVSVHALFRWPRDRHGAGKHLQSERALEDVGRKVLVGDG